MVVLACSCAYPAQDELYGRGMRLFNERQNNKAPKCTVCGREAPGNWASSKEAKKKGSK